MAEQIVLHKLTIDLVGQRFGRLLVTSSAGHRGKALVWDCRCDCGNTITVRGGELRKGDTKSCGCLRREMVAAKNSRHGLSGLAEYEVWKAMKSRTLNPNDGDFGRYGGRGITLCDRWRDSFEAFHADMGPRPLGEYTLERIDNNGGYCPENCRWATRLEQAQNREGGIAITFRGQTKSLKEWSLVTGLRYGTLYTRLYKFGWSVEEAFTLPHGKRPKV